MQPEFDFEGLPGRSIDGVEFWRKEREKELLAMARKHGLPIGQKVEVWLRGGVRLRGSLRLVEERLFQAEGKKDLILTVDGTAFAVEEMESCVRL